MGDNRSVLSSTHGSRWLVMMTRVMRLSGVEDAAKCLSHSVHAGNNIESESPVVTFMRSGSSRPRWFNTRVLVSV
jgi:hypothetical protein